MLTRNIPVLIVGAGPVGLSLALALARQNISSLVIERHPSVTQHPRARGVNIRTMELFRQWGNAEELLKHEQSKEARRFIWATSLQGEEVTRIELDDVDISLYSPTQASLVSQDHVEESLCKTLSEYPQAQVEFLKEYISFEENAAGIVVCILDRTTQQKEYIQAQYLIAADGAHSGIRKQLNIAMDGPENLGQFCSVYCEIDISQWTKYRPCIGYFFTDLEIAGRFLASVDGANRWILGIRYQEGNTKEDFTDEYCVEEIRRVTRVPDLQVHIINKSFWTMAAQIATHYRQGKVFLAGDAAHRLPPTGGLGMNTGVQDAHNLAWKLAHALRYGATDKLLDSYYEERAPIAKQNMLWSKENAARYTEIYEALYSNNKEKLIAKLHEQKNNLNHLGLDFGFIYHSNIVCSENAQTLSVTSYEYRPTTLSGARAPHVSLIQKGKTISSLDLFEKDFVLLVSADGSAWKNIAQDLNKDLSFPLKTYQIANDGDLIDLNNNWLAIYQITATGAVLVRPDGHVAWRSQAMVEDPKAMLMAVLKKVCG